jgi:uncharacterized membrane protein YoaK (UPF0700 family)
MISKLPPWVEVGGFVLAFIAGAVNAIGLLGFEHQAVSHLTGIWTLLGLQIGHPSWSAIFHLVLIVVSFVLGAALSGLIIRDAALRLGRRYGVALLVESALLFWAMIALNLGSKSGHLLASAACGLQNALASTFSGAVVRTTHVTGLFTDLGIMMGSYFRGLQVDRRRVKLYLLLILGFIAGAASGGFAYGRFAFTALAFPATLALALSLSYWLYWWVSNRKAGRF